MGKNIFKTSKTGSMNVIYHIENLFGAYTSYFIFHHNRRLFAGGEMAELRDVMTFLRFSRG